MRPEQLRKYTIGMQIKLNFINITLSSCILLSGYLFFRKKSPSKHKVNFHISIFVSSKIPKMTTIRKNTNEPINNHIGLNGFQNHVSNGSIHNKPLLVTNESNTLGHHVVKRLVEIGINDVFAVPGDFNLTLLDYLVAEPEINLIGCCNELNAGYATDGYARCRGVGACVVTFSVGGLSILNAIAGAYSEDLPIICIVGAPNSNDFGSNKILHHTIGLPDFSQELRCFEPVTCHQVTFPLNQGFGLWAVTHIGIKIGRSRFQYRF